MWHPALIALYVVVGLLAAVAIHDVVQKKSAIKHNFPVVGWVRYLLEGQRTKIRQYFISGPRDERPYTLRQREYVYRSAKQLPSAIGFGSDADLDRPVAWAFLHAGFPTLTEEAPDDSAAPKLIGPHRREPFQPRHFVNISDMSFG